MSRSPHGRRQKRAAALSLGLAVAVTIAGIDCTRDINLLGFESTGGSSGVGGTAGKASGGASGGGTGQGGQRADAGVGDGPPIGSCIGTGDPLRLPTPTSSNPVCAATLAARTHRFAVCSCSDWNVTAPVFTDAMSSRPGMIADPFSAALGINGSLTTASGAADVWVRGSVYVGGAKGILARGHLDVGRTLQLGGPLVLLAPMASNVWADAYAGGDVSGALNIKGTLHLNAAANIGPGVTAAATTREPVTIAPPCDCGQTVDVSTSIANAMTTNDNATLGLSLDRFASAKAPAVLDLPCGVFALSSIAADASLTLNVHGRAMLAVSGDIVVRGGLVVRIDPGVSLDLLVGGSLLTAGAGPVGSTIAAAFRVWVKGAGPVTLEDGPVVGGIIYAPAAAVSAPEGIELYGALLAGSVSFGDLTTIHFDQGVLSAGCGDPKVDQVP